MTRNTGTLLIGTAVVGFLVLARPASAARPRYGPPAPPPHPPNVAGLRTAAELLATLKPGDEADWSQAMKLAAAHPGLRLPELLEQLRGHGYQPVIGNSWRALSTQDILLAEGSTKVSFSFHNAVDEQGYPRALAADLIDRRYGFGDKDPDSARTVGAARFFAMLGREARALGLTWGGDWDRTNVWASFGMGWDPVHVQALPNRDLPAVRDACLPRILGPGVLKDGSGGYRYRQWPNGYLQIVAGQHARGELILPKGDRAAWTAITAEIGPYPGARLA